MVIHFGRRFRATPLHLNVVPGCLLRLVPPHSFLLCPCPAHPLINVIIATATYSCYIVRWLLPPPPFFAASVPAPRRSLSRGSSDALSGCTTTMPTLLPSSLPPTDRPPDRPRGTQRMRAKGSWRVGGLGRADADGRRIGAARLPSGRRPCDCVLGSLRSLVKFCLRWQKCWEQNNVAVLLVYFLIVTP